MNFLFFLEPSIELNNPLFRYATLRSSLLPQIKTLRRMGHDVVTLLSDSVAQKCIVDNKVEQIGTIAVIDSIEWMNGEGYFPRSLRHQSRNYFDGELLNIKKILLNSIGDLSYKPDVIIVWETPAYYLEELFPEAKCIYQMPGVFSRPPFANLVSFDDRLLERKTKPVDYIIDDGELSDFEKLREKENSFFSSISPTKKKIEDIRKKYSKIVLFPLQIDNYFMVSSVLGDGKTQFDALISCLKLLPGDIALIVTNYISRDIKSAVLSHENIKYLRNRFPNFKYIEEFDLIPCVSQYLVREVDGVISISSSLGYQARYWGKPLLTLGTSHIQNFATTDNFDEFIEQIYTSIAYFNDSNLIGEMKYKNVPQDFLSSDEYPQWLINAITSKYTHSWCDNISNELAKRKREKACLDSLVPYIKKHHPQDDYFCKELSAQIQRYSIISFDIFDTLLMRPFRHPTDLYDFIEPQVRLLTKIPYLNFKKERKNAEKIAFENAIKAGVGEITIEEIYKVLGGALNISAQVQENIMQLEMQTEYDLLYPRKSGYRAYLEAKQAGKKIIFISDMYLGKSFLAKILHKNGYEEYDNLYVSSEHRVKKHSGELFDYVINDLGIEPQTILHIGDNVEADVKKAKSRNIKPFHLKKAYEDFTTCSDYQMLWSRDENKHSLDWKILLSIAGNNLHDNPYLPFRKGTIFGGSPLKLGYYGLGPLLLGYAKWLVESAIKDKVERLYFLSRDGKIMKQAYDIIAKLYHNAPESYYLLCSRRAINLAKVKTYNDIIDLANVDYANNVRLSHLLFNRFGLQIDTIADEILEKHGFDKQSKLTSNDVDKLQELLLDVKDEVLSIADKERCCYLEYLNEMKVFDKGEISIVDIGYAGTMQQSLYQLSSNSKKIGGYYLITFRPAIDRVVNNLLDIKSYLAEFIDRHDTYHPFCRYVPLYETLFSCSDTTFIRMTKDLSGTLVPVFMESTPVENTRKTIVEHIQKGAVNYISEVVTILGEHFKHLDIEPNKTLRALNMFFSNPHPRDAKIFSGVVFEDAYGGTQHKTILPDIKNINSTCVWETGRKVLRNNLVNEQENQKNSQKADKYESNTKTTKQKIIYSLLVKTLAKRKREKFIKNPELFFYDSKKTIVKSIGKLYLS